MPEDAQPLFSFCPRVQSPTMGVPIAPLIDIVFLLNCFFMMATEMIQSQADPRVELPGMTSPVAQSEAPAEVIVNLCPDGALAVNGTAMPLPGLSGFLAGEAAQSQQAGRLFRVVIRADRRQRYARLDEILQACEKARLSQVVIRAREGEQP